MNVRVAPLMIVPPWLDVSPRRAKELAMSSPLEVGDDGAYDAGDHAADSYDETDGLPERVASHLAAEFRPKRLDIVGMPGKFIVYAANDQVHRFLV